MSSSNRRPDRFFASWISRGRAASAVPGDLGLHGDVGETSGNGYPFSLPGVVSEREGGDTEDASSTGEGMGDGGGVNMSKRSGSEVKT